MKQVLSKTIEEKSPILWSIDRNTENPREIILAGAGKRIKKFHINLSTPALEFCEQSEELHSKSIRDVKFSPDGTLIAAGSFDGSISIYSNSSDLSRSPLQEAPSA